MKKPVLLLQFRTDESLRHEKECVMRALNLNENDIIPVNVFEKNPNLPNPTDLNKFSKVIFGGSGQFYLTDLSRENQEKLENLKPLVKEIVAKDFPTFGICFGHQIFAQFLGGKVERDEKQMEGGVVKVRVNGRGKKEKLFVDLPEEFHVATGHKDSVTKLPKNAVSLASTDKCEFAAMRIKKNIYTVQFHPELTVDDLVWKLSKYPDYANKPVEELKKELPEMPYGTMPLKNFLEN